MKTRKHPKKPHLFKIRDAYRVLSSLRGDIPLLIDDDKTVTYYVATIWELFKQILWRSNLPTESYGYYRSIIAYCLRYDPDYLASKFIFAIIRDPPVIRDVGNLTTLIETVLRR